MSIVIPNFNNFIKTRKGIKTAGKKGLARGGKSKPFFVPPLNTNPNLAKLPTQKISKKKLARAIMIPPSYDLIAESKYSGRIIVPGSRSSDATSQFMQYSCGSCWAYAVATCISDAFVVANNLAYNPRLSWTYMLACSPHTQNPGSDPNIQPSAQCGGGDVASALLWVQANGIASSQCVDYSWCVGNSKCTGSSTDADALNALIPSCGCYDAGSFLKYKIKNVKRMCLGNCDQPTTTISDDEITTFRNMIKQHIIQYGPVIGALILMGNVVDRNPTTGVAGDFKSDKNPQGVYLECVGVESSIVTTLPAVENDADQCVFGGSGTPKPNSVLGGHAIAVIGWGEAPVHQSLINPSLRTKFPPDQNGMIMVPFWRIRNSWGNTYADGGNYNHAMYPFNKVSQIDKTVTITDPSTNSTMRVGGCVTFEPDTVEPSTLEKNNGKGAGSAGVIETSSSDVNTGLFPGKDSSTGSSSNASSSGKIAYAPLYGNPPEKTIPLYTNITPTTTTSVPQSYFEPPTSTPPPVASHRRCLALILWIVISCFLFLLLAGGASYLLYKYRDKIKVWFSSHLIVPSYQPLQPTTQQPLQSSYQPTTQQSFQPSYPPTTQQPFQPLVL